MRPVAGLITSRVPAPSTNFPLINNLKSLIPCSPFMACRPTYGRGLIPRRVDWLWPAPAALRRRACLFMKNGKGDEVPFSWRDLRRFVGSYARPELSRRDADQALEGMGELALVREAGAYRDLRQGEVRVLLQELLGPLDAAPEDVLVRRRPGRRLELPREVVGAEMGRRRDLFQGQAGVEVFLDVLDDGAKLPLRERAVRPTSRIPGGGGVANQVDGEQVGQGLGGETAPGGAGRELVIDRQHRGPQLREVQTVQRRQRHARGVEIELLGGRPCDQFRLQEDVKGVRVTAPAPPGRAAGRYHQDRAGGGRDDAADPFVARLELLRRMKKEEERVVRQGGLESLIGGLIAVAQRLQAHPPSLVARRARLAREMLDEFKRAEQAADSQLLLSHHLSPHEESGRPHPHVYFTGQGQETL